MKREAPGQDAIADSGGDLRGVRIDRKNAQIGRVHSRANSRDIVSGARMHRMAIAEDI